MAKLVLSFQGRVLEDFPLDKPRVSVGRAPDNDICIENLAVSGRHAVIETVLKDSFLVDLDSTNGTFVNGTAVSRHPLRNGDYITIGKHSLTYHGEMQSQGEAEVEKTIAMRPTSKAAEPAPVAMIAKLQVQNGGSAGREMTLSKPLTKLGKAGFQVAAISRRQQDYYLEHIEGKDGRTPKLNGVEIGLQPRQLNSGDLVEIAGTQLKFMLSVA
ncbi:Glycogen accumulation regulator GarA [Zhongshania aliphaticivorans]|uniref:Glycogen accumulation regulator GarA n=1 Tax=Zhongshania aliphaticivorans TaxID=1470434 RepID=A0A5S9PLR6_9GAMM|nr:FHA domain-containing protein [Zhongshania aliphaticivorans]CAA0105304.1 Glycogen accumulation regulator GarA [Zhongshania aliphaticivorans]CAA0105593.1 Glycogen accumulation regulator GarA [Zhongshania aliphaticivorans]